MPPRDAHHHKLRLYDDLGTDLGRRLYIGWVNSLAESQLEYALSRGAVRAEMEQAPQLPERLRNALLVAETFYASPDMITLAQQASRTMPNETLLPEDLPSQVGFLYLPQPIGLHDVRGRYLRTHAMLWFPVSGGIRVFTLSDKDDPEDDVNKYLLADQGPNAQEGLPQLQIQHIQELHYHHALPIQIDTVSLAEVRKRFPGVDIEPIVNRVDDNGMSVEWLIRNGDDVAVDQSVLDEYRGKIKSGPDPTIRFLITFFRLCQQSITSKISETSDRALRRRMERVKMNPAPVTVVTLRRVSHAPTHGTEPVNWSHRWVRRGHWRQQWYGSGEDRYQRAIYIDPTICGPEGAPLLVREHVHALLR